MKLLLGCLLLLCFSPKKVLALECYICDSAEDSECATRPGQQLNVEECSSAADVCVTVIVGTGVTRRGCLSRLFPNKYCPEPCDHCSTNLCNRHIYPKDRLRCYQCVGAACIDVTGKNDSYLWPCPVFNEKDRCYTHVVGISNVQRGCEYTNLPATCPNTCLKCNYDACNNELGVHEQSCLECSHTLNAPNPDCWREQDLQDKANCAVTNTKRCTNKLLYGDAGKCFTYINEQTGVMQRGCSTTMGFFPTGTLTQCYGENCNSECLAIACNNCSTGYDEVGASHYNCRFGINLHAQKCNANNNACYTCEQGSKITRGCITDAHYKSIQKQSNAACYECRSADGCNRVSVRTCFECTTLNDANCSEMLLSSAVKKQNCSHANELCVSTLLTKLNLVYVVRGCASRVAECTATDPFCMRCNASLCNDESIVWYAKNMKLFLQQRSSQASNFPSKLLLISLGVMLFKQFSKYNLN